MIHEIIDGIVGHHLSSLRSNRFLASLTRKLDKSENNNNSARSETLATQANIQEKVSQTGYNTFQCH